MQSTYIYYKIYNYYTPPPLYLFFHTPLKEHKILGNTNIAAPTKPRNIKRGQYYKRKEHYFTL